MLKRKRVLIAISIATLTPNMALAHGGEVLFLPLGQVVAVVLAVILLWPLGRVVPLFALFFAVGIALSLWLIPWSSFPQPLRGITGQFFVGFVPPLAVVGLIIFVFRSFSCRNKKDP
jgi:hypothetical protein